MWPFTKRAPRPAIPKYGSLLKPKPPEPVIEPPPEPMIVEEVRDPSESAIIRFIHKVRGEK
jgi:hypothetical protein